MGERRARRAEHGRTVPPFRGIGAAHVAEALRRIVRARQHRQNTGHLARRRGIDAQQLRMGMGRAQENGEALPVQENVVRETPLALQEARSLHLKNRLTDGITRHLLFAFSRELSRIMEKKLRLRNAGLALEQIR